MECGKKARSVATWLNLLQRRDSALRKRMEQICGGHPQAIETRLQQYETALNEFNRLHGEKAEVVLVRSPARINLMGVHVEHRGGWVNYMAISREIALVAQRREDDAVQLSNVDKAFEPRSFRIGQELPADQRGDWLAYLDRSSVVPGDWGNYVKAAVLCLQSVLADRALKGMNLVAIGDIPQSAGLSSSSALVVASLEAALWANGLTLTPEEKVQVGGDGEWYVGTRGGAGDHAAMIFGKRDIIAHTRFFPLVVEPVPFPQGYRVIACDSLKEARKAAGAKSIFNGRIAAYEIGLLLVKERFPQYAERLTHLRDLNVEHLGVDEGRIYEILKALPQTMTRREALAALPEHSDKLETLFATHDAPQEGYSVRDVCLFGLAESDRGKVTADLLRAGKIKEFGELMYRSHDGDRLVSWMDGKPVPWDSHATDACLDGLVEASRSRDPAIRQSARLCFQPGGYRCSCRELDLLVDIAKNVPGVAGAGLTGGGLGGAVLVLVREEHVGDLVEAVKREYYEPRRLPLSTEVCLPVEGAGLI
jgi:N-acetylgalactosamine kinase